MTAHTVVGNVGVGSWIERRARAAPDAVALIAGSRSLTYSEVADRGRRLANGLRTLGVAKGDRVAWLGPNHPAFLESLFAAGLLGAVMAPVNHRLDEAEISWVLEDIKPRALIQHCVAGATAVPGPGPRRVAVGGPLDGAADFEALVAGSPGHVIEETVGLDDLCLLPHTSGTTGRPKGVMLTHGNITWNVINLLTCATSAATTCCCSPKARSARLAPLGRHRCSSTPRLSGPAAPMWGHARRGSFWYAARTSWLGTGTGPRTQPRR
jgi:fatty-acyl-CoA synthase